MFQAVTKRLSFIANGLIFRRDFMFEYVVKITRIFDMRYAFISTQTGIGVDVYLGSRATFAS